MKITKHGLLKDGTRVNLKGICDFCGCQFDAFVDIFHDVPNEGDVLFRSDIDCLGMSIKPEWASSGEPAWRGYVIEQPRIITNVDYSISCPECQNNVELKVMNDEDGSNIWQCVLRVPQPNAKESEKARKEIKSDLSTFILFKTFGWMTVHCVA